MAQAKARIHRYEQNKTVYICHFAALHTIDVDILEHRHMRKNGVSALNPRSSCLLHQTTRREKSLCATTASWRLVKIPAALRLSSTSQKHSRTMKISFNVVL
jgi:hypothetical protein